VRLFAVVVIVMGVTGCGGGSAGRAAPVQRRPPRTLVFGDSLIYEARFALARTAKTRRWGVSIHAFAFASPCEWRQWFASDWSAKRPEVIGLLTLGNTGSGACRRAAFGSEEYFRLYREDLEALTDSATAAGARVVFFAPPPLANPVREAVLRRITRIAQQLARRDRRLTVSFVVRDALSDHGRFAATKPCRPSEDAGHGCRDGAIVIRTRPPAPDAGIHLCPLGLVAGTKGVCAVYSSGEQRLADAMADLLAPRSATRGP
jgi:hypothetical protein